MNWEGENYETVRNGRTVKNNVQLSGPRPTRGDYKNESGSLDGMATKTKMVWTGLGNKASVAREILLR